MLSKVWAHPEHHAAFRLRNNLMYTDNRGGEEVLCVPHTKVKGDTIIAMITAQAHQTLGHLGAQRTVDYIRRWCIGGPSLAEQSKSIAAPVQPARQLKPTTKSLWACFTACQSLHDHGGRSLWTLWGRFPQAMGTTTCGSYSADLRRWCTWSQ